MAVSLNPETMLEGGGLIDDQDVTVTEARFEMFDYGGKIRDAVPSLKLTMETEEGEEVSQNYSAGSAKDWMPTEDGKGLAPVGSATALRLSSNAGIFFQNLVDAGFPADRLGEDVSVLEGLKAHVIRIPAPKRGGLQKEKEDRGFADTVLVVDKIHKLPWEKGRGRPKKTNKAKAKSKAKTAEAPSDSSEDSDALATKASKIVMDILLDSDGSIDKKHLPAKIFSVMKSDPDRNAVIKTVFDDEFLSSGEWKYEDGVLTLE